MARGGHTGAPSALEAPASHPQVELLWAVSAEFSRRHQLPTVAHASYWMAKAVHENRESGPMTRRRAERKMDVLRSLATWPTFTHRPLLAS
jgi:hypothetical protein